MDDQMDDRKRSAEEPPAADAVAENGSAVAEAPAVSGGPAVPAGPPLIELREADICNEDNRVVSNVTRSVSRGDFVYLVGRVGSGKSSIIKTLIAELPLRRGYGRVGEYSLAKIKKKQIPYLRRKIGVVFQDFQLLMDRSVEENLLFVLQSTGWKNRKEMKKRSAEVLSLVGMETKAHKMPHQLSGGEQQRVAIARALLNNPSIILADEPTGHLDADTAEEIMDLLMQIHRQQQPAVVMVTHNRQLFAKYPGRVMVCEKGECRERMTPGEILIDFDELMAG